MSTITIQKIDIIPQPRHYTPLDAERAALAGAVTLTAHFEGSLQWVDLVDLEQLHLYSLTRCVLGQVFGDWNDGLNALRLTPEQAATYGFDTPQPCTDQWILLQQAWDRLIHQLRAHR